MCQSRNQFFRSFQFQENDGCNDGDNDDNDDEEEDDSNDEGNWRNDYPDEDDAVNR